MAAGGWTGLNRFLPIRADLNWSAPPDPRIPFAVRRIFGRSSAESPMGALTWGSGSRHHAAASLDFPAIKRGFRPGSAHLNDYIQPVFQAHVSGEMLGAVCRLPFT
jgi:hypothetical protein